MGGEKVPGEDVVRHPGPLVLQLLVVDDEVLQLQLPALLRVGGSDGVGDDRGPPVRALLAPGVDAPEGLPLRDLRRSEDVRQVPDARDAERQAQPQEKSSPGMGSDSPTAASAASLEMPERREIFSNSLWITSADFWLRSFTSWSLNIRSPFSRIVHRATQEALRSPSDLEIPAALPP